MDLELSIHRLRIGDWIPSSIKSIAVNPFSNQIAVGKVNGDIDIYDTHPGNKLYCYAKIVGRKEFQLQSLVWSNTEAFKNRLFGISLRGFIFEVDLALLQVVNIRDTYGGAAWAMSISPREQFIAVGCEDGIVRVFQYDSNLYHPNDDSIAWNDVAVARQERSSVGILSYRMSLPTSGSRILSVAYHPVEARIFIGCSDGTIRCMDEHTGRVLYRMLGDVLRGSIASMIWSLVVLADSTVVSGDSRGQVQIWDGTTGVLMDSFRQHTADVLALAASPDGSTIFAAGVDGKVICLQKSSNTNILNHRSGLPYSPAQNTWLYVHSHRAHSHDVLSLAVCTPTNTQSIIQKRKVSFAATDTTAIADDSSSSVDQSSSSSSLWFLVSGGIDARLSTYSVQNFVRTRPVWIPSVPTNTLISSSTSNELIALKHNEYVDIWKVLYLPCSIPISSTESYSIVAPSSSLPSIATIGDDIHCQLGLRVNIRDNHHIQCSTISPCGLFFAISSSSGLRVYQMNTVRKQPQYDDESVINLKKMLLPELLTSGNNPDRQFIQSIVFGEHIDASPDDIDKSVDADIILTNSKKRKSTGNISGAKAKQPSEIHQVIHKYMAVYCVKKGVIYICEYCTPIETTVSSVTEEVKNNNHTNDINWKIKSVLHHSENISSSLHSQSFPNNSIDPLKFSVKKMSFSFNTTTSSSSHYLAVLDCCSPSTIYIYDLKKQKLHWKIPTSGNLITDFIFKFTNTPTSSSSSSMIQKESNKIKAKDFFQNHQSTSSINNQTSIIITYATNLFTIFDIEDCNLNHLSESQDSLTRNIPKYIQELAGPICGITIEKQSEKDLILYGHGYCIYIDLEKKPHYHQQQQQHHVANGDACSKLLKSSSSLREQQNFVIDNNLSINNKVEEINVVTSNSELTISNHNSKDKNFIIFNKYRNLLSVNFKSNQELVIIENPWVRIMPTLPDTLFRKRYGT